MKTIVIVRQRTTITGKLAHTTKLFISKPNKRFPSCINTSTQQQQEQEQCVPAHFATAQIHLDTVFCHSYILGDQSRNEVLFYLFLSNPTWKQNPADHISEKQLHVAVVFPIFPLHNGIGIF